MFTNKKDYFNEQNLGMPLVESKYKSIYNTAEKYYATEN